ncbi:MAG: UDP-N-acetylmuramoyl-tripeptide--D-alanyl-D-alanine ligase, partial [candidate division KSB1 bacterium]|nr:UDP-N-acetylmuramoyl-tripeptide--D-alanyl-D-alanine ligase [candidate division KSB1 bacterium]
MSRFYRLQFDLPLLALTGSNGKTTTKEMISTVLGCKYQVHKNKGNLNNHIGVPLSLLELTEQHEIAVIEMGTNHFGEISRLADIAQPTCGLITNIGPAHLEFFGSLDGVFRAKKELWQFLEQSGGTAFVNVDDPLLGTHRPATDKVVTFGFENPADFQGKFVGLDEQGRATLKVGQESIKLGVSGMHNIYNALAAIAVGSIFQVSFPEMKAALEAFVPAARRMEVLQQHGITIINDCYNSNPASARKALQTLSQIHTRGRRIAVLADMLELGAAALPEHQAIADYIVGLKNIDYLLAYGPLSAAMVERAHRLDFKQAIHFETKQALIKYLKQLIVSNDLLLIKGSRGMAMEEVTQNILES